MKTAKYILFVFATLIVVMAGAFLLAKHLPEASLWEGEPLLDQDSAFNYLEELATKFPQRDIYHPDGRAAAVWLREELEKLGLETHTQEFSQFVKDGVVEGQENVYAISKGILYPDEYILIVAHYDIPPFVTQGAADNASGVGVTLELARLFSQEQHNRSMIFLMSDSEEYGAMAGVVEFIRQFENIDKVKAAIVLDFLNMGEMKAISVRSMGLQQGYTPLWMRELTLQAIEQEVASSNSVGVFEWVERSVAIAPTEAGVTLREGIPAVNIGGVPVDRERQNYFFHTEEDTVDKLEVVAMGNFGRATERTLRALDEMPVIPDESMFYFKYGDGYLPNWAVALLQLLIFSPLAYALIREYRSLKSEGFLHGKTVRAEVLRWLSVFGAGVAGFIALKVLPYTGLMYRYELYPATQKDPVLYNPQYLPLLIIVFTMVITFLLLRKIGLWQIPNGDWRNRKLAVLGILTLLALVAWVGKGGFAAVVFLFLPAYLWPFLTAGQSLGRRLLNLFIVLISNAVFFVFIYLFSTMYDIGVMWWYLLMGASYGLFSPQGVLMVVAGFSLYFAAIFFVLPPAVEADRSVGKCVANKN